MPSPSGRDARARAVEDFAAVHGHGLIGLAYVLTGSKADAEDLWQDTLVDVLRHWDKVSASAAPRAYVRAMLVNRHTSSRRRLRWSRELVTDPGVLPERGAAAPDLGERVAAEDAVWESLRVLAPRPRAILALRFVEDLDDDAIAAALGISRSTVSATASRGLATLRAAVTAQEETP